MQGGNSALSASAINRYLNCPLQFYLQYIEKIEQTDEVAESVDSSTFGSIYHGMMQKSTTVSKAKKKNNCHRRPHRHHTQRQRLAHPVSRRMFCQRVLQNST